MQDFNHDALEREFTEHTLSQMHPQVRDWRGSQLDTDIRAAMKDLVSLVSDDGEARRFADIMEVTGMSPDHFKVRLIEVDGHRFLAQIDFTDETGASPFVSVFRGSSPPGTIAETSVLERLAASFAGFAPRTIRFFHPAHASLRLPRTRIDQHFLAAPAREMADRRPAAGLSRVKLSSATSLAFYADYVEAYEQMYSLRPHLRNEVRIESQDSLGDCLAEGLLFEISVDGVWAGIVAARRETLACLDATYMIEILLDRTARGQGLGPAVHQRLAIHVAATDPSAVISGTIAPVNVPSLKTALRAGRIEIGAWHWLDL